MPYRRTPGGNDRAQITERNQGLPMGTAKTPWEVAISVRRYRPAELSDSASAGRLLLRRRGNGVDVELVVACFHLQFQIGFAPEFRRNWRTGIIDAPFEMNFVGADFDPFFVDA